MKLLLHNVEVFYFSVKLLKIVQPYKMLELGAQWYNIGE